MRNFKTFADAYQGAANELLSIGETFSPRGSETKEITDFQYRITDPYSNLYQNDVRSVPKKYLANELIWYFSGSNDVNFIGRKASMWKKLKNPDGKTVNSAYGYLLFSDPNEHGITEWEWAKQNLIDDIDTRQALIRFNKSRHSWFGNRDFVCTLTGWFSIRNNRLNLSITQRSCDIMTGLTYDVPYFMLLMQLMIQELEYEEDIKLEMGTFTHTIHSLHIYKKDYDKLLKMLDSGFFADKLPVIASPYIRETLDGIIQNGIIPHGEYLERQGAITADPLLEWCFRTSGWDSTVL